jgi:hypothetical protein
MLQFGSPISAVPKHFLTQKNSSTSESVGIDDSWKLGRYTRAGRSSEACSAFRISVIHLSITKYHRGPPFESVIERF